MRRRDPAARRRPIDGRPARPDPAPRGRVPAFAAVRVDDERLGRGLPGPAEQLVDVLRRGAVDPHRQHPRGSLGQRERLRHGRAAPQVRAVGAREAQPAARAGRRLQQLDERDPLLQLGDRFAGQQVRLGAREDLEPLTVERPQLATDRPWRPVYSAPFASSAP